MLDVLPRRRHWPLGQDRSPLRGACPALCWMLCTPVNSRGHSQSLWLPETHFPPKFPVTLSLLEVSTASAWTDGDTHMHTHIYKSILLLHIIRHGLHMHVWQRDKERKGKCGARNKHFAKCQLWSRQTCTAFTSKSGCGHRFSLAIYKERMVLLFLKTGISAFLKFLGLSDTGEWEEKT